MGQRFHVHDSHSRGQIACHALDGRDSTIGLCCAASVRRWSIRRMFARGTSLSGRRHGLKCRALLMAMLAEPDFSNTTIRRFDILRLIARGGMGEVYVARDAVLGRDLALKILRQDVTWDANRLERFVQEARAASALNHPHLIAIYDIGESAPKRNGVALGPPVLYIAMELVAGETLRKAIESKRLDVKRALEYLAAGRRCAGRRPRRRRDPSRSEARELDDCRRRLRQGARLRRGQAARGPGAAGSGLRRGDPRRGRHWYSRLHVARAGPAASRSIRGPTSSRLGVCCTRPSPGDARFRGRRRSRR